MDKSDTFGFILDEDKLESCIYNVPINIEGVECAVDVMPSSTKMNAFESKTANTAGRENLLRVRFEEEKVADKYDFVVMDCPPSLNQNTFNAFMAADYVIVPAIMDDYALPSISFVVENLKITKRNLRSENPKLIGIVPSMYDVRQSVSKVVLNEVKRRYPDLRVFTPLRLSAAYRKAQVQRTVVFVSEKHPPKASEDNYNLVTEIIEEIEKKQATQTTNQPEAVL